MDISTPIEIDIAVKGLGGEPSVFYMMLGNLEPMSLNKCVTGMVTAYDNLDYKKLMDEAHSVKGASAYVGASRLHYMCYFIQEHHHFKKWDKMLEYYPSFIEAAIEFKVTSRKLIAKHNN